MRGMPGKRASLLEVAKEADDRGFAGLATFGSHGNVTMCASLLHATRSIDVWSSIQPLYPLHPNELAESAAQLHELSGGRFRLGLGVSRIEFMREIGYDATTPLAAARDCITAIRAQAPSTGELPPIWLAALRDKMLALATELADGVLWAQMPVSHAPNVLAKIPDDRRASFTVGAMVATIIDEDLDAARALLRSRLLTYLDSSAYRNFFRAAGYGDMIDHVEQVLTSGDRDQLARCLTDDFLSDVAVVGSPSQVHDRLEAWYDLGVMPICAMSSTRGGQAHAIRELFELY